MQIQLSYHAITSIISWVPFFCNEQLVTDLEGVDVCCTPPELSVKLQDSNDTHTFQWTFTLVFKVSKINFKRDSKEQMGNGEGFLINWY